MAADAALASTGDRLGVFRSLAVESPLRASVGLLAACVVFAMPLSALGSARFFPFPLILSPFFVEFTLTHNKKEAYEIDEAREKAK